jgi:hypothetical protein
MKFKLWMEEAWVNGSPDPHGVYGRDLHRNIKGTVSGFRYNTYMKRKFNPNELR